MYEIGDIVEVNKREAEIMSKYQNMHHEWRLRVRYTDSKQPDMERVNEGDILRVIQNSKQPSLFPPIIPKAVKTSSYTGYYNQNTKRAINPSKQCPKCGTDWHITESPIFGKNEIWYDCDKCNKRREDLV